MKSFPDLIANHTAVFDTGTLEELSTFSYSVEFFIVSCPTQITKEQFITELLKHEGEFNRCNPLDGKEHSYIELSGWIGDHGLALRMMALGFHFKVWDLLTPSKLFPNLTQDRALELARVGLVTITAPRRS